MPDPVFVTALRAAGRAGAKERLWTDAAASVPARDFASATHVSLPAPAQASGQGGDPPARQLVFKITDRSGYKDYEVGSVLFFFLNMTLDHQSYLRQLSATATQGRDVVPISFIDRKDLIDYLTGVIATSVNVRSAVSHAGTGDGTAGSAAGEGISAATSLDAFVQEIARKRKILPEATVLVRAVAQDLSLFVVCPVLTQMSRRMQDKENTKRICAIERTINTPSSVMSIISGTKESPTSSFRRLANFTSIQKQAYDKFVRGKDDSSRTAQSSSKPTSSRNPRLQKSQSSSQQKSKPDLKTTKIAAAAASGKLQKPTKDAFPIIMVPAAAQSLLTLYNVKEFLIDQKFTSTDEYRNRGEHKPTQVILERDPSKLAPGSQKKFLVLDSIETLRPPDWDRVVAVFTNGQEWQFRGWKWDKPVDIFHNVLGFSLKFQDEPPPGQTPSWNVEVLNIHRSRRYLDGPVVYNFWQKIDGKVKASKAGLCVLFSPNARAALFSTGTMSFSRMSLSAATSHPTSGSPGGLAAGGGDVFLDGRRSIANVPALSHNTTQHDYDVARPEALSRSSAATEKDAPLMQGQGAQRFSTTAHASHVLQQQPQHHFARPALAHSASIDRLADTQLELPIHPDDLAHADREGVPTQDERGASHAEQEQLIQMLCDFPDGFSMLLREAKKTISSTKASLPREVILMIRKRAEAEEQYAKSMHRIAQMSLKTEGKGGSFANAWQQYGRIHERLGNSRGKWAEMFNALADEMTLMQKDTERSRKNVSLLKEGHARRVKEVQDADAALEKTRIKYESTSEEWERSMSSSNDGLNSQSSSSTRKQGVSKSVSNSLMMFKAGLEKNFKVETSSDGRSVFPPKLRVLTRISCATPLVLIQRNEEESRAKAAIANENYKAHLQSTNMIRNEFYRKYLPQFIQNLKQTVDEADDRLCQYLMRFGDMVVQQRAEEESIINPQDKPHDGFFRITEMIDNRRDFEEAAKELTKAKPIDKNDREYVPFKGVQPLQTSLSHSFSASLNELATTPVSPVGPTTPSTASTMQPGSAGIQHCFGVRLLQLTEHDTSADPVPLVVIRCIEYIETCGIGLPGIYRVSGPNGQVQKLKQLLDRDAASVRLDQVVEDIHALTGVLKLFFRELPDPLLPRHMYRQFIDAAKIDDERMRLIQIHELVNTLDDAHYATLKCLAGHLWRVRCNESENKMTITNLGIVWGPTLMDPPDATSDAMDLKFQSKVVETIVGNFEHIFDMD
ncbi:Rho GTPase-activating protein [Polyrhizophydium stewartii]|uniref:Rho GTPase-activating protein n=1 Tax=Polyrhizophydium stewartii TaxID=2732419 RepID=A0ABR4N2A5_9FUNG